MKQFLFLLITLTWGISTAASPVGVVQQKKQTVNLETPEKIDRDVELYEVLFSGSRLTSGSDGWASLRLVLEKAGLDIEPQTSIELKMQEGGKDSLLLVTLELGEIRPNFREKTKRIRFETRNTVINETEGRSRIMFDKEGTTLAIVQSGQLDIYNRPKDMQGIARAGQKAISNKDGLVITDAEDDELDQFRQNYLEIDFVNPQTDETSTLEIEYGVDF